MSTTPSFRLPFTLPEDTHPQLQNAIRSLFNAITNHEQAFTNLKSQVTALQSQSSQAVTNVNSANVIGGTTVPPVPAAYTTQQSDYGALVIMNNGGSSAAVTLNSNVKRPYYTKVVNQGSANVTLTPDVAGATINGSASLTLTPGQTMNIYLNSADYNWSAA